MNPGSMIDADDKTSASSKTTSGACIGSPAMIVFGRFDEDETLLFRWKPSSALIAADDDRFEVDGVWFAPDTGLDGARGRDDTVRRATGNRPGTGSPTPASKRRERRRKWPHTMAVIRNRAALVGGIVDTGQVV